MTTREMLFFCGSVLAPVLIAHLVAELLREVPALSRGLAPAPAGRTAETDVERLLRQALPQGVKL